MIDIIFDMETSDPDDALTLCMLATHPKVALRAVTVTPGSRHQVGVVKRLLKILKKDIPVGAYKPDHPKECVSLFHYKWLGEIPPQDADGCGDDVMMGVYNLYPDLTVVTGASLGNLDNFLARLHLHYQFLKRVVIQGGFAGDSVVPKEHRLPKFEGLETCATYNLGGNRKAAESVLHTMNHRIIKTILVSKNVCHGVLYDREFHGRVMNKAMTPGMLLVRDAMEGYLYKNTHKALHDPLAACVAIDESVCGMRPVDIYYEKGRYGSLLSEESTTSISVSVDKVRFEEVMTDNGTHKVGE